MLKHVSYRASSTSLSRPFGNCRTSSTLPAQCDNSAGSPSSLGSSPKRCSAPASAPNSPQVQSYGRHVRHNSVTPLGTHYTPEELHRHLLPRNGPPSLIGSTNRHTYVGEPPKTFTHQRALECTLEQKENDIDDNSSQSCSEQFAKVSSKKADFDDSISLKSDDPLMKHKNDLRSMEALTLRGELLHDLPNSEAADSISLQSAMSMSTLCRNDLRASTTSLCNPNSNTSKVPVRIHLRQLRPDIEYKTLKLDAETSCRQLVEYLLQKLRLKHRDPNLFAVVLEAAVRGPAGGAPIKKRFLLEDSARPVELQQCRPRGEANFSITMRRGGVLRVRDSVLAPGSQYKSVLVSYTSTVVEVIQLLLRCNNRSDDWRMFTLHEVCSEPYNDRLLRDDDKPLHVQNSWSKDTRHKYSLVLRRHLTQGLIENKDTWRRLSIDDCSLDAETELDEHNSTCSSIMTNSSSSSRSRASISSSTASVLSLASLSSNSSSRCSFSSGSSSGVSSGSSSSCSPTETPDKDRKVPAPKRQLPVPPRSQTPISKVYPISAEENIQSYFTMASDDELEYEKLLNLAKQKEEAKKESETSSKSRPPQPLPRRILSYPTTPLYTNTAELKLSNPSEKRLSKSLSSPLSWAKARGPAAQIWQSSSKSARIRSATISSSIDRLSSLSIHSRSKSSDGKRHSTSTLTSEPSTPSSPFSLGSVFSFKNITQLSKSQSTSSINNSSLSSPKIYTDHSPINLSSTKLRPLSLAPNSCVVFPSRPSSLISSQSQSTSTLRASSSSLCLSTSLPDKSVNNSSSTASSPNADHTQSSSSLKPSNKFISESFISDVNKQGSSPTAPQSKTLPQTPENCSISYSPVKSTPKLSSGAPNKTSSASTLTCSSTSQMIKNVSTIPVSAGKSSSTHVTKNGKEEDESIHESCSVTSSHSKDGPPSLHGEMLHESSNKHCPSCCHYESCFYI